jgi:hypothetical protein
MTSLDEAFNRACARYSGSNFDHLDEVDKVLVTIWSLEGDVNNGGFDQYYFNSSGDLAFYAPTALRNIGAHHMAKITDDANKLFGPQGPAGNRDEREAQLHAIVPIGSESNPWDELDQAFYSYPDDVSTLLTAFLQAHGRIQE